MYFMLSMCIDIYEGCAPDFIESLNPAAWYIELIVYKILFII